MKRERITKWRIYPDHCCLRTSAAKDRTYQ